ncbi:MAG: hypothetical protein WC208_06275 [Gallionella sp.]|jgi:uncharacterized membrane protein
MKLFSQTTLIAVIHATFIFAAYGTKFFGIPVPSDFYIPLWLGAPAIFAFMAYFLVLLKTKWLASALYREGVWVFCASLAAFTSTYLGVFFAFNTFGE